MLKSIFVGVAILTICAGQCAWAIDDSTVDELSAGFDNPPDSARPGVYWYVMDGNLSRDGITSDLESMKSAGLRRAVFLEVNVGVPRGTVDFLSEKWQDLFAHMIRESERLGIEITLGAGPGWTGSGGPWVRPEDSMQHLVTTSTTVEGGNRQKLVLPVPDPKAPYFGEGTLTPDLHNKWKNYYRDVAVLAYPETTGSLSAEETGEKALFYRAPYTSVKGVVPYFSPDLPAHTRGTFKTSQVIDLSSRLGENGELEWDVPPGRWTIMRLGARNNGAITRPAPVPGLGFEADKFSTTAMQAHLDAYTGKLLEHTGQLNSISQGGLKRLHMDSWEMGAQNWSENFRAEFTRRRGYDPLPYFPAYAGVIIESREITERFLWDLRITSQELVLENHAGFLKKYAHDHGMKLSIEPYDMNPTSDLELGSVADIPMGEFWSKGYGFNSAFSCIEAASIGHIIGSRLVQAEAFTGDPDEAWHQYPASMKNQGDWAFAMGINQFFYHTFAHQTLDPSLKPGMTMGPYGVHWDSNQTFWPMVNAYHDYIARCQYLLQQGTGTVADVLYLAPESAPHVFRPPASAMEADDFMPDRKGYNFDGCPPSRLYGLSAGQYKLIVLPAWKAMSPQLLKRIIQLAEEGATIVGNPPERAPGLSGYPQSDAEVKALAEKAWGGLTPPATVEARALGKGRIVWGGTLSIPEGDSLYPDYSATAALLLKDGVPPDFTSDGSLRYTHRKGAMWDAYFVSNRTDRTVQSDCGFRMESSAPVQLWDPVSRDKWLTKASAQKAGITTLSLELGPHESRFVIFDRSAAATGLKGVQAKRSNPISDITLTGAWDVLFDPASGGPGAVKFDKLDDWTSRPEDGIKFYSGLATYRKTFDWSPEQGATGRRWIELGNVHDVARVRVNGKNAGVVWTAPWRVDVSDSLKIGRNEIEIEVANRWINRLIGDASRQDDGIKNNQWPEWLRAGGARPVGENRRLTFTTYPYYKHDAPLQPAGLVGPVRVLIEAN